VVAPGGDLRRRKRRVGEGATGMPTNPGIRSNAVATVELQVGQKLIVTRPPDAPAR
jgi:hypothetical protein